MLELMLALMLGQKQALRPDQVSLRRLQEPQWQLEPKVASCSLPEYQTGVGSSSAMLAFTRKSPYAGHS